MTNKYFILAAGAPASYVGGHGLLQAGAIVSVAEGTDLGKWFVPVSDEDFDRVKVEPSYAQQLAAKAGDKVKKPDGNPLAKMVAAQARVGDPATELAAVRAELAEVKELLLASVDLTELKSQVAALHAALLGDGAAPVPVAEEPTKASEAGAADPVAEENPSEDSKSEPPKTGKSGK